MTSARSQPLRLAYFGLPLAAYLLARDGHDVRLAVLPPARGPGRRRLAQHIGAERVLDALERGKVLEAEVDAALAREAPDLVVSWFWTRRLPERWLAAARLGGIGAHPSLLPRHRGPDPYFWAIDSGDVETGVTIHRLSERYDDGEILSQGTLPVGARDAWQLARALDRPSLGLLRATVASFADGGAPSGNVQNEALATWAPAPSDAELHVDFRWPTERVLRRIRALSPSPGVALELEGLPLVVTGAREAEGFPMALEPGEAAVVGPPPVLVLRTGNGAIAVDRAEFDPESPGTGLAAEATAIVVKRHLAALRSSNELP